MILDEVSTAVAAQLDDQSKLGVQVVDQDEVPETGPASKGLWLRVPNVTAVFADLIGSTALTSSVSPEVAAIAYTYFARAMTVTLERFSAGYVEIQGDGVFGLFAGKRSMFHAAACAITMRSQVEGIVSARFQRDASVKSDLKVGVGVDRGTLIVRQLGLRGTTLNEVWAGKPVSVAAKLSSVAGPNRVVVSDRMFAGYEGAAMMRQQALIWSCGCDGRNRGPGLGASPGQVSKLWTKQAAPKTIGVDFGSTYARKAGWCAQHGAEFCEAILTGRPPAK